MARQMRSFRRLSVLVLISALSASSGLLACGVSSASSTYGPSWGRFTAGFTSNPRSQHLVKQVKTVPGAINGYGYAVTADKHIFSSTSTSNPPVPTEEVVAVRFRSTSAAAKAIAGVRKELSKPANVSVDGAKGFQALGRVAATAKTSTQAASKAFTLGVRFLVKGTTGYQVVVAASTAAKAKAFLVSVKPAS
ncbi:MAG: hypothetical protein ACRDVW_10895 [Acidimicrobiales bacterium]